MVPGKKKKKDIEKKREKNSKKGHTVRLKDKSSRDRRNQ